jgi:RNA recognition motif-containing protein
MQGKTLYVGNLTPSVSREQLRDLFSGYGSVLDVKIVGDNAFGFIEMSSQTEAESAKSTLNGYNLDGTALKVDEARPKNNNRLKGYNNNRR